MKTGIHGEYSWIESGEVGLNDLLSKCPAFVLGYQIAITSCDSGPMRITEAMEEMGWTFENEIAVSPRITSIAWLGGCEWDEWYIFDEPPPFGKFEVFVNYGGFSLTQPQSPLETARQEWLEQMLGRFWRQIERLQPHTYVADGDQLVVATKNALIFEKVKSIVSNPSSR